MRPGQTARPYPNINHEREHPGAWLIVRDRYKESRTVLGHIYQDETTGERSVMLEGLYWTDGQPQLLDRMRGRAVRVFKKNTLLSSICHTVSMSLGWLEEQEAGHVEPATIAPRVKPKITIDLEPQPRAVTVTSYEDRSAMVTIEGLCNLPLSEPEARALWAVLGNHLCEPAGPGLDRRGGNQPPMRYAGPGGDHPSVKRDRARKAQQAVDLMLANAWEDAHDEPPTHEDLQQMRHAIGELGQ